jgi:heme oxygenase-like protein
LLEFRRGLEEAFEKELVVALPPAHGEHRDLPRTLIALARSNGGRSLSEYAEANATLDQLRELVVHRSAYHLKEADPHTWAIPRLSGRAKAALVEIQADEYGDGVEVDMHQSLFAVTLRELGLDPCYGAYLDVLPGTTLATVNLVTLFGLHRRWRGALVGHLAVFEMTSVEPMGRYAAALRRLGFGPVARHFYEVHVVADAHHEKVAAHDLAGSLAADEPALAGDILFGARAVTALEARLSAHLLRCFRAGRTSLLRPLAPAGSGVPTPPGRVS